MYEIFILLAAGLGAGVVTGLFGGSDTITIVPILVILGGYHPFVAVGVGLASDVFSAIPTYIVYKRHGKIEIRSALPLLAMALVGVTLGTIVSTTIPAGDITLLTGFGCLLAGIMFMAGSKTVNVNVPMKKPLSAILGFVMGFVLGTWGAGGGIALLVILTMVLGYSIHNAVGTSSVIMGFTALIGAASHNAFMPIPPEAFAICIAGSITGAFLSSAIANRMSDKTLRAVVGVCIVLSSVSLFMKGLGFI
jgi:uncharacterized protein